MTDSIPKIEEFDEKLHWRCPRLGGQVPFRYCRLGDSQTPCARIMVCWETLFDIQAFLGTNYDLEELRKTWEAPPKDKVLSLFELIQKSVNPDKKEPE